MYILPEKEILLASSSPIRQKMLTKAGLSFTSVSANIDEDSLKEAARLEGLDARDAATMLAEMKAMGISRLNPGAFVIGADQILDLEGRWFSKPKNFEEARHHLQALSGRFHHLSTASVVYHDGVRIWHHFENPKIFIRSLDEMTIDDYIMMMGDKCFQTPGVYMMEGLGAQIIGKIDGCPYAVLGLPLLQLLDFLRGHGLKREKNEAEA